MICSAYFSGISPTCYYPTLSDYKQGAKRIPLYFKYPTYDLDALITETVFKIIPIYTRDAIAFSLVCKGWNQLFCNIKNSKPKVLIDKILKILIDTSFDEASDLNKANFLTCQEFLIKKLNDHKEKNEMTRGGYSNLMPWDDLTNLMHGWWKGHPSIEGHLTDSLLHQMPYLLLQPKQFKKIADVNLNNKIILQDLMDLGEYQLVNDFLSIAGNTHIRMKLLIFLADQFGYPAVLELIMADQKTFKENFICIMCSGFPWIGKLDSRLCDGYIESLSLLLKLPCSSDINGSIRQDNDYLKDSRRSMSFDSDDFKNNLPSNLILAFGRAILEGYGRFQAVKWLIIYHQFILKLFPASTNKIRKHMEEVIHKISIKTEWKMGRAEKEQQEILNPLLEYNKELYEMFINFTVFRPKDS